MQIGYRDKHYFTENKQQPTYTTAHLLLAFLVFGRAACDDTTHSWKQNQLLKGNMSVHSRPAWGGTCSCTREQGRVWTTGREVQRRSCPVSATSFSCLCSNRAWPCWCPCVVWEQRDAGSSLCCSSKGCGTLTKLPGGGGGGGGGKIWCVMCIIITVMCTEFNCGYFQSSISIQHTNLPLLCT